MLADISTGRVVAHEEAWVRTDEVNPTPAAFYRDSPVWTADGAAAAYLRTCALFAPDAIDPAYLRAVRVQALVSDGIRAYEARRYRQALELLRRGAHGRRRRTSSSASATGCIWRTRRSGASATPKRPSATWWITGWSAGAWR